MSGMIGKPVERVDGRVKVTGAARYTADYQFPGMLHAFLVTSTIARGEVLEIDTSAALAHPGVVAVYTHRDMERLTVPNFPYPKGFIPMQDTQIRHSDQPVALTLAATVEQAQEAAALVRVRYRAEQPRAVLADAEEPPFLPRMFRDRPNEIVRGDAAAALASAPVRVEAEYSSPPHHHNPIEPPATIAHWEGEQPILHVTAQGVGLVRMVVDIAFGRAPGTTRVIAPYLGGGFGAKGTVWPHTILATAAARRCGRPVKLVLTRAQMYTSNGHRSQFHHRMRIGATRDGRLTAIEATSTAQLSRSDEAVFNTSDSTATLYACPNVHIRQLGARLDIATSSYMRSPEMTAHFGLETALDELSHELGIDPVELRIRNHTEINQQTNLRYSSKHLIECYRLAANAFGWARRRPKPGTTRENGEYVGWGMATETHSYAALPSTAALSVGTDGRAHLRIATQDIGTGTYTVITQIAADALGMPMADITSQIGDTDLPPAGPSAGSATVAGVSGSVDQAARAARDAVVGLAVGDPRSPLSGLRPDQIVTQHGHLFAARDPRRRESYRDVVSRAGRPVEVTGSVPNVGGHSFGAVFAEVRVQPDIGAVRVSRVVTAHDFGRVMNRMTARGQVIGGVTWGLGFVLMEHTVFDRSSARVVNPNLSTYLIPVHADVPVVESLFVDRPGPATEALGARGFGELPITGVPAAIGNAVFHATGRRIRDLPITQDKLL